METGNENLNNVFVTDLLKAYPVPLKNHNKVVLPGSLLKEIHDKKVWDNRPKDKPLIFELIVADPDTSDVLEETHVGVDSFTAPNGTIGLPYKTALSLTKERGIGWLKENPFVSLRLINVESAKQSSMKVQPRGKGFFLEDESIVQLDIKTVLELTLKDHLVLTEGDWIPLFWDGNRFELVVKELQPNQVIDVLNTDLTVEMLPSEETEQTMKEKERAQKRVTDFMEKREKRNEELSKKYARFKESDKSDGDALTLRVRLPKGGTLTKTLSGKDELEVLCDFIDLDLFKRKFVPLHMPPEHAAVFFNLVYALPGQGKVVIDTNKYLKISLDKVFATYNLKGKMHVLSLEMIKEDQELYNEKEKSAQSSIKHINNDWLRMADRLEACLQENEEEVDLLPQEEVEAIVSKMTALGVDQELGNKVARLYGKQVNELINMGYADQLPRAVHLLNEKRGNLEEVVNALLV